MAKNVLARAVRSDGREFIYQSEDWGITKLEGIDFPPIEIFTQNRGFGNGAIITGKRKGARDITIVARGRNRNQNEQDRKAAIAFHNLNYTYDVYFTYMGTTLMSKDCELQGVKCPSGNVYSAQELTVSFLAPDADLLGDASIETQFKAVSPLWHCTRAYPPSGFLAFGVIDHATSKTIEYLGSEPAPIEARVEARGLVEGINVSIGNVDIAIDCTLTSGDVLVLNSETKTITINNVKVSENLYNSVDLPNLQVQYGDNIITIEADDSGNTAFDADVNYTGRYGGL